MDNYRFKAAAFVTSMGLFALSGCATLNANLVFWARSGEIESTQARASILGLEVQEEAYKESLRRWPNISRAGLQRRAILYSLLKSNGHSLSTWQSLSSNEDLNQELVRIVSARSVRSAF